MENWVLWYQRISRSLGCVIHHPYFVSGEHSIKYGYVALPRKQVETGYHSLLLVCFRQFCGYPHAQTLRNPYAVSLTVSIRSLEAFGNLTTGVVFSSYIVVFRASSSPTCARPLRGSSEWNKQPDLIF